MISLTGNDIRVRIALFLNEKSRATFAEIRNMLRINNPRVNNNTVRYHLKRLMKDNFVFQSMKRGNYDRQNDYAKN